MDPGLLTGRHKARKDKAERMESVMEGREVGDLHPSHGKDAYEFWSMLDRLSCGLQALRACVAYSRLLRRQVRPAKTGDWPGCCIAHED